MTNDLVIHAEGLGKKFVIGHRGKQTGTLRDALAASAKRMARTAAIIARGRQLVAGDQTEEFWALRHADFEIRRGDTVGVIGKNGAGKSTLLKVLSRITEPSEGRVTMRGRVASLLEVGTGFHPELSGRENIFLNGAILGMTRAEIHRAFDQIVDFAGVERFLDTPVKRYSSGMYVRLAFSVAAHLEPEILVVDEVLAVGDMDFQKRCLGKMQSFAGSGRTVIFVSHQLPSIVRLCNRAMLFESGGLKAEGTPQEMISLYRGEGTSAAVEVAMQDNTSAGIQITRVAIFNTDQANGEDLPLSLDVPLTIVTRIRSRKRSGEVALSFALMTPDGTVVFATNSTNAGIELNFEEPGDRELTLTLDGGQLLNNELVCRVALWNQADGVIDEFETALIRFAARETRGLPVRLNGLVNGRSDWSVQKVGLCV